eukprot:269789-Rhodomonas_salina.1
MWSILLPGKHRQSYCRGWWLRGNRSGACLFDIGDEFHGGFYGGFAGGLVTGLSDGLWRVCWGQMVIERLKEWFVRVLEDQVKTSDIGQLRYQPTRAVGDVRYLHHSGVGRILVSVYELGRRCPVLISDARCRPACVMVCDAVC